MLDPGSDHKDFKNRFSSLCKHTRGEVETLSHLNAMNKIFEI